MASNNFSRLRHLGPSWTVGVWSSRLKDHGSLRDVEKFYRPLPWNSDSQTTSRAGSLTFLLGDNRPRWRPLARVSSSSPSGADKMRDPFAVSLRWREYATLRQAAPADEEINVWNGHPKHDQSLEDPFMRCGPDQPSPLLEHFSALLRRGNLEPNEAQRTLIRKLQLLMDEIEAFNLKGGDTFDPLTATVPRKENDNSSPAGASRGVLEWLLSFRRSSAHISSPDNAPVFLDEASSLQAIRVNPPIRGLYIWGGVGQGKTMIMDAFYDTIRVDSKTRVHFHQFMLNVHERLHHIKTMQQNADDALAQVAREIRQSCQVLCFDEFQVTHIADAMVLKGFFEALFSFGCVVVATSNRPPSDLYSGGLNRDRFLPFIDLLNECCETFHIDTQKDFRLTKRVGSTFSLYHTPPRPIEQVLEQLTRLSGCNAPRSDELAIGVTRTLKVPFCTRGFAVYSFRELCETTAGVADYLALAKNFHTIFLRDIPCLAAMDERPNEIRRFISLIDVLYERHSRVIFDAEVPFSRLFGTTAVTDLLENLRKSLATKYANLQEFLNELSAMSNGGQEMTSDTLSEALTELCNLPRETGEQLFDLLEETFGSPTPIWSIREALFLHASSYDAAPPTRADPFLFGPKADGQSLALKHTAASKQLSELAYDQLSGGASVGAQDNKFSYARTVSRIREMISEPYVDKHQKSHGLSDHHLLEL